MGREWGAGAEIVVQFDEMAAPKQDCFPFGAV
jgi:hypothetical protein